MISKWFHRGRRRSRGATLLETVVVTHFVLIPLIMGGVEFGWYLYAKHVVQSAARDAARTGIIGTATHAQAQTAANETMTAAGFQNTGYTTVYQEISVNGAGQLTTTTVGNVASVDRGEGLRVTISAPFSAFKVRPLGLIKADKQIVGVCTMVKE